ncbi:MAG TPA: redox-regulated ATPase YchF [Candidatus Hydrogenedentes bacterium]|nr:redox-regulated ATPase YchF [Candidatus Hydrogenedentota bacterium]HOV75237.1 redox-regulated ATPase YchF [Candidatus Hydrogenedentota bacterium]HPC17013.1 redox-regulated ATPase YchF [Candidatus Hydrogenedentota bacterium]HRT20971.1 redox-regulated ATPase YchF [Candidatus Hydrogenedentota bacterium]HRT65800.1 redox-regulated ATPase YchF [Candidatus Hydrogenedentota bacterium]
MKIGIIGLARSGKTTLFNALSGAHAAVGAFGSRDANVAVIKVPDARVDRLAALVKPKKTTYAEIQFIDIAPNEAMGEKKVLDSAALTHLKNTDALVHVVRAFKNEDVMHPAGSVDPVRDARMLEEELQLTDLIVIEKRIERIEKEHKKGPEHDLLVRCRAHIEGGAPLRTLSLDPHEVHDLAGFCFLSQKPLMLLGNYGEESIGTPDPSGLQAFATEHQIPLIDLCGEMEFEVAQLPESERQAFRDDLGLGEESRTRFIQAAYDMLGLMSFLTAGEPEVRAWTIRKGTKAVDAAGVIHSDIQRGFIRAEIVGFDHFMQAGSMAKAREQGHMRLEGKEYIFQDGDIVLFRFNV